MTENVVRGDAGLTAVQELSEDDPPGGQGQIGTGIHNAGAFASQFQYGGSQVLRRLTQHHLPYGLRAGKENEVEF